MDIKTFLTTLEKELTINGPSYRGAKGQSFSEKKINESEFSTKLANYKINFDLESDETLVIDWFTNDWTDNTEPFFNEVKRCINFWVKKENITEPFFIVVLLLDKDGIHGENRNLHFNV